MSKVDHMASKRTHTLMASILDHAHATIETLPEAFQHVLQRSWRKLQCGQGK